jgi:hypothetical protein
MTNSDWSIRRAGRDDRDAALDLLRRAFGRDVLSPPAWEWAFGENPSEVGMRYLVAETGDRLVGQWASVPTRIQHCGREVVALRSQNAATDSDWRRQGILTALMQRVDDEFGSEAGLHYGFPNRGTARITCRAGSVELRTYPLLVRPVAVAREAGRRRRWALPVGVAGQVGFSALAGARGLTAKLRGAGGRSVEQFEHFGPWADRLWEELAPHLGTCAVRDAAYLNWRFVAAPHGYRLLALSGPGDPEGFAVTRTVAEAGRRVMTLMELMVRPGDTGGAGLLIDRVVREASAARAAGIVAVATRRQPFRNELFRSGFVPALSMRREIAFTVRTLGHGEHGIVPNEIFHVDDWYLSAADLDYP